MEHLIANSGIQFIKTKELEFNPAEPFVLPDGKTLKYTFLEYVDTILNVQIFDFLCYHSGSGVFIPLNELRESGQYATCPDGREDIDVTGLTKIAEGVTSAQFSNYRTGEQGVFSINSLGGYTVPDPADGKTKVSAFELLLGKWLPMPMFEVADGGYTMDYPLAWCRAKIERIGKGTKPGMERFRVIWAFDTELSEDPLSDMRPVFYEGGCDSRNFALCNCAYEMFRFMSTKDSDEDFSAFSDYIYGLLGSPVDQYANKYIAYYIYFVNFLRLMSDAAPEVVLYNKTLEDMPVDLVLDIGNSRTCGVLFEEGEFTKGKMLKLRDLTDPSKEYDKSFDMRFVFRQADFGNDIVLPDKDIFRWCSFVRVGEEAKHLIYRSLEQDGLAALATNYSSPKRYLWDTRPFDAHWENLIKEDDSFSVQQSRNIYIPRLSEMFDTHGNYIPGGEHSDFDFFGENVFSRSSLMTFVLIEIFQQAMSQINSVQFRTHHGDKDRRRVLRNIILTCPTAMPRTEQVRLRKSAEDAYDALCRCIPRLGKANIIPASDSIGADAQEGTRRMWSYDEASCCQLTYLYAEIYQRYQGAIGRFFDLKGHVRPEDKAAGYNGKSLTIGSIDIGAGTTDVMVCSYLCDSQNAGHLTPRPLYWDSFYLAGDDVLRNMVQYLVLEGKDCGMPNIGSIRSALLARVMKMSADEIRRIPSVSATPVYGTLVDNIARALDKNQENSGKETFVNNLMCDFFGNDSSLMSHKARRCRLDFNTQISVPITQLYLENLRLHRPSKVYTFEEIFSENRPAGYLLDYFAEHFGFRFEELSWRYDPEEVSSIVKSTLEPLMKQLAIVLYAQHCDIIVLAGRPTSLDAVTELFVKYVPVTPDKLIRLNEYHVGNWFPTAYGEGYFYDQKAIVAVGAMVGFLATTTGLKGLALDFEAMIDKMKPTANYIGEYDASYQRVKTAVLTPAKMTASLDIPVFPVFIGCRQYDSAMYQARPLYALYSKARALKVTLTRDYQEDREHLELEDVQNEHGDQMPLDTVELVPQSLVEDGKYWLDKGEFRLSIHSNR